MIKLNDYLYSGDTVVRILNRYSNALYQSAMETHNSIDFVHYKYLQHQLEILEHNEFLTSQAQRIREFYKYMVANYPQLAFTFKGRIKSVIRSEQKFNGYLVEYIQDYYSRTKTFPSEQQMKNRLSCFRDLIAYRIVISVPNCHLRAGEAREDAELRYLYQLANDLPGFLKERGFTPEPSGIDAADRSRQLSRSVNPFYRDYIQNPTAIGYRALHITFYDDLSHCYIELQLRTKSMDDFAEIGPANHGIYEARQGYDRSNHALVPPKECPIFDEALERVRALEVLELSDLNVNMFGAVNNHLVNDGCGLFRGRQITPYEHLSRFQNDQID